MLYTWTREYCYLPTNKRHQPHKDLSIATPPFSPKDTLH